MRPWESFTNQAQWKEYLQNLLRTNDKALYRAIVLIAGYQTPMEVAAGVTFEHNGVGFGAVDAEFLTEMAFKIEHGRKLSEKELAICRNKMPKYWKQLYNISKRRQKHEKSEENSDDHLAKVPKNPLLVGDRVSSGSLHNGDGHVPSHLQPVGVYPGAGVGGVSPRGDATVESGACGGGGAPAPGSGA